MFDMTLNPRASMSVNETYLSWVQHARYNRPLYDGIVKAKLWELEKITLAPLFSLIVRLTRIVEEFTWTKLAKIVIRFIVTRTETFLSITRKKCYV